LILAVGVPAYGAQVHAGHVTQAIALGAAIGGRAALQFTYTDSCSLDWSRNFILHKAITQGADWLLMCDADTYCPDASKTLAMLREADERGARVIATPVLTRRHNTYNAMRCGLIMAMGDFRGQVVEVDRIGTAFMAIDCTWVKDNVPYPWFTSEQLLTEDRPGWIGEDFSFCDRVRSAGGTILADGRFEPVHTGTTNENAVTASFGLEVTR
jgi:hypothetical protein